METKQKIIYERKDQSGAEIDGALHTALSGAAGGVDEGMKNEMEMTFDAVSENEAFARMAVAAFVMPLDPTVEELSDIKTSVSEAVTNCIIHGYDEEYRQISQADGVGRIHMRCVTQGDVLCLEIRDEGKGITDISQAMEPMFTTKPQEERSGMGFSFMEAFMDRLEVASRPGCGTVVMMEKKLGVLRWEDEE